MRTALLLIGFALTIAALVWPRHLVITIVEGEQTVPLGPHGSMIRVVAAYSEPSRVLNASGDVVAEWPTISIRPADHKQEVWTYTTWSPATFPMKMKATR